MHHNFATVRHMRFSAKCSERSSLHDKGQCLNMAIKYSSVLQLARLVKYLKTKLTEKSLRQICGLNKVPLSPLSLRETVLIVSTARTNNGRYNFD